MSFTIDWYDNNAIITMTGEVDFKEIDMANGLLYGDKRFEKMRYQIFDIGNASKIELNRLDFELLGTLDKSSSIWNKKMKVAVVFRDDEMINLMEVYKKTMEETDWEIEVFKTIEDAKKWCQEN